MPKPAELYYKLKNWVKDTLWPGVQHTCELIYRTFWKKTLADYLMEYSKDEWLKPGRKTAIENVATLLKKFQRREGFRITPKRFNRTVANDFIFFLQRRGLKKNTIRGYCGTLKTYIRVLDDDGIRVNKAMLHIIVPKEEYAGVVLIEPEVLRIYRTPTKYTVVQIYFLIGCFTGLRESDFFRITKEHIRNGIIVIRDQKTGQISRIPVHWIVKEIFEKYHYKLPKPCSATYFNITIKKICREAGLIEPVVMEHFVNGKLETVCKPKCDFISSHTARRTFISMLDDAGISIDKSMILTPHASLNVHLGYMAGKKSQTATELKKHPFFTGEVYNKKD